LFYLIYEILTINKNETHNDVDIEIHLVFNKFKIIKINNEKLLILF